MTDENKAEKPMPVDLEQFVQGLMKLGVHSLVKLCFLCGCIQHHNTEKRQETLLWLPVFTVVGERKPDNARAPDDMVIFSPPSLDTTKKRHGFWRSTRTKQAITGQRHHFHHHFRPKHNKEPVPQVYDFHRQA